MRNKRASVAELVYTAILLVSLASPSFQQNDTEAKKNSNEGPPLVTKVENSGPPERKDNDEDGTMDESILGRSAISAKESYSYAHGHEDKDPEGNTHVLILERGDAFTVLATNNHTGCMYLSEDNIPPQLNGDQRFGQDCDPNERDQASSMCRRYTNAPVSAGSSKMCLKPTHLLCDPDIRKCVCGNEGIIIPPIRFQVGNYAGKNYSDGICFIRPTFDFIPGFECAPGTVRKGIVVEEDADPSLICACEIDADIDKFDTSDKSWWRCGGASTVAYSHSLLLLTLVANNIKLFY